MNAELVIAKLKEHRAELEGYGVKRLTMFGSVARGSNADHSDVDLSAELKPEVQETFGILELVALENRLQEILGCNVDLIVEPIYREDFAAEVERDSISAF